MIKIFCPFLLALSLCSCVAGYQPLKKDDGYRVLSSGKKTYRIEYFTQDPKLAEKNWALTANEACPAGYTDINPRAVTVVTGDYLVPIAGTNQRFERTLTVHEGEVECVATSTTMAELTTSQWSYVTDKGSRRVPVSQDYLRVRFQTGGWLISELSKLTARSSMQELTTLLGKPQTVEKNGNIQLQWPYANGGRLIINRKNNCNTYIGFARMSMMMIFQSLNPNAVIPDKLREEEEREPVFFDMEFDKGCGS